MSSKVKPTTGKDEVIWEQTVRLLNHGIEPQRIATELEQQKWTSESARGFVELAHQYVTEHNGSAAGIAERKRRMLVDLQVGGLWLGGALLLGILSVMWPKSEILPFIAVFAGIYGVYEIYLARKRRA